MRYIYIWGSEERYPNYRRALVEAGGRPCFSWSLDKAAACDGLLLPGGGDLTPWRYGQVNTACRCLEPDRDRAEMWLLERFSVMGKPVLGICRGLQSVNVFFGGTLVQDLPGHDGVAGIDRLHRVHTAPSPFRRLWMEGPIVNSAHHQAADQMGSGLRAVQWAADGTVEALCHERLPIWAVQWHPERLSGPFSKAGTADGAALFGLFLDGCG